MAKPLRIAFGCQARVGKDSACTYLQEKYGGTILHFSDPLYAIMHNAQDICGFSHEKDVQFLQWIGTEWGRAKDPDVWVKTLIKKASDDGNYFVADLRFPNEVATLKMNGFICIRIIRDNRALDRNQQHASETALLDYDDWDGMITNNGCIEEFYQKLDEIIHIMRERQ